MESSSCNLLNAENLSAGTAGNKKRGEEGGCKGEKLFFYLLKMLQNAPSQPCSALLRGVFASAGNF